MVLQDARREVRPAARDLMRVVSPDTREDLALPPKGVLRRDGGGPLR